ncbi:MAG: dTMP kinase [Nanoarchaeota archaeon]
MKRGHEYPGAFVVLEGCDGTGKSTQYRKLLVDLASRYPDKKVTEVREPGGTEIGERIRDILLDPIHTEMTLEAEFLLYSASRGQLTRQRIIPALKRNEIVLADRFYPSTWAYQGAAGGLFQKGKFEWEDFMQLQDLATSRTRPDLTAIFDVSPEIAQTRLNPLLDRMEQKGREFFEKVRAGYHDYSRRCQEKAVIISAEPPPDVVYPELHRAVFNFLDEIGYK